MEVPILATLLVVATVPLPGGAQWTTSQHDNARTGANLKETILTPANVNPDNFGKIFSYRVDGDVYAQPLYLPHVAMPDKSVHNVVVVATEHDSVYAFDADGRRPAPLWHVDFLGAGVTTVPARDVACPLITPEIGITSTPVIDPASGTLYVLARTKESQGVLKDDRYVQRLHALAITTGAEKFGGPVEIKGTAKGRGASSSNGLIDFDPLHELPRAALLLAGGNVYLTWGSSCDVDPYHGWLMAYDARTLAQKAVFNSSPDAEKSGIWMGDTGPAADQEGNVFVITGNGKFSAFTPTGRDYGDSVLKLVLSNGSLSVQDFFTPFNQQELDANDFDLGSGGPILLPDQPGPHRHLLIAGGKGGGIYVIDRDHLGKYHAGDDSHAVQVIRKTQGIYSAPSYWNQHVFFLWSDDVLKDFRLDHGQLSTAPVARGTTRFTDPGATPTVSANGNFDGIVWLLRSKGWSAPDRPAVLYAIDAANVSRELYNSEQNAGRDRAGLCLRFSIPMVAGGKVYVGAKGELDVYGLRRVAGGLANRVLSFLCARVGTNV
jgi:hypothetical protein